MRNAPGQERLLEIALETYKADVLPHVPSSARYAALMVANAMGVVLRQMAAGPDADQKSADALRDLLGPGAAGQTLAQMEAILCDRLRQGTVEDSAALYATLCDMTEAKAKESVPKSLAIDRTDLCLTGRQAQKAGQGV